MTENHRQNKHILLGVTGCIAAYKSAELIRLLKKSGVDVRVIMTESAKKFITPLTLQTLSKNTVYDSLFNQQLEYEIEHISLARWADLILIAPSSANCIAKLANGIADDLLTTVCLATTSPIMLAPTMNLQMWRKDITQQNISALKKYGAIIIEPAVGEHACGEIGVGRMPEPKEIFAVVNAFFAPKILSRKKILITAGPSREAIDPVRFISNQSSGKMGYAIAEAAYKAGANVTLISGPVNLTCPIGIEKIDVISGYEMYTAVINKISDYDIFISAAAVSDYLPATKAPKKIKKTSAELILNLKPNIDILTQVAKLKKPLFTVGFAAETENLIANAKKKLKEKKLDMIVANLVGDNLVFGSNDNKISVIYKNGKISNLNKAPKKAIAAQLINIIAGQLPKHC